MFETGKQILYVTIALYDNVNVRSNFESRLR